ncbi:MAG: hypothetical protein M3270_07350 [Thermoproteota archaeon]|nr:hypothetical protein [Thermoproteota archaeon]
MNRIAVFLQYSRKRMSSSIANDATAIALTWEHDLKRALEYQGIFERL